MNKSSTQQTPTKNTLVVTLPSDTEVKLERMFNAPRPLVWKACTDPKHIPHWWGHEGDLITVDKMNVKVGGEWRIVGAGSDGIIHAFRGVYKEIIEPEKLSYTFIYEPIGGDGLLETMYLEEKGEQTFMVILQLFDSKESRDGMLAAGMEEGAAESFNRLEELLQKLK